MQFNKEQLFFMTIKHLHGLTKRGNKYMYIYFDGEMIWYNSSFQNYEINQYMISVI